MRDLLIMYIVSILLIVLTLIALFSASGCAGIDGPTTTPTPREILYKTVVKTNWLATAAIIGIAASAFAFLNGNKIGIAGMVSCFIALSMTLAVARYAAWLAAGGVIGSVGLLIYSIFVKDRALKEVVKNVEGIKTVVKYNPSIDKSDIKNVLSEQSPTTKKIVKKIKGEKK